jgi:Fic family protein
MPNWIWQHPQWPHFTWRPEALAPLLRQVTLAQGELLGRAGSSDAALQAEFSLDALLRNIVDSSSIEGESLNVASVRSSLARRLGLEEKATAAPVARGEGLARIIWDATTNLEAPLDATRLLQWHQWLFAGDDGFLGGRIRVGAWRGLATMQVVSGRVDKPVVHFEAPPREGLEAGIAEFLAWFDGSRGDATLDPLLRAAIAHFWFVTLHPFDDGNGRIARSLTDLALAQGERQSIRFYAMSAAILADRKGYYRQLEVAQQIASATQALDLTPWLHWFLLTLRQAVTGTLARIDRVLGKSRFWLLHRQRNLGAEQIKVLNRLLEGDQPARGGFTQGISAAQYQAVAKVSKATATRHLADLVAKGCLTRLPGGGRNTRYQILWPAAAPFTLQSPDGAAGVSPLS